MREFAARLIAFEASGSRTPIDGVSAAFAVPDKMRANLTTLMGSGGHRALPMRTLVLAGAEVPWLRGTRVDNGGNLERPAPAAGAPVAGAPVAGAPVADLSVNADEVIEGGVVLVAQLIGLLVAFIGERLTLQLVGEVWPKLPAKDLKFKI